MLAALVLIGVAAVTAIPFLISSGDEEAADAEDMENDAGLRETDPGPGEDMIADDGGLLEFLASPAEPGLAAAGKVAPVGPGLHTTGPVVSIAQPDPEGLLPPVGDDPPDLPAAPGDGDGGAGLLSPVDPDAADLPGPDLPGPPPLAPQPADLPDIAGPDLPDIVPLKPVEDLSPFEVMPGPGDAGLDVNLFVPGKDLLEVTLFTDLDPDAVSVVVGPSADGLDGVVMANDQVIAVLRGAPGATAEDVALTFAAPRPG